MTSVKNCVNALTLKEKALLLQGKSMWKTRDIRRVGIPSVFCADGPHGVRRQRERGDYLGLGTSFPATCFPASATLANSWDTDLVREVGAALGLEASIQDVQILLGPGLNIKRSPLCGRNFEYFSEDPYFSGKMAAAMIRGIQSQGVAACPKHFAVNSQELRRMAVNAVLDERTLREIYLTGFEIAVKEGQAKALMTSYNQINGMYANENSHLLSDILRGTWGFDGIVLSDWGGSNDHTAGVAAGSHLEMPGAGGASARQLVEAVTSGKLPEHVLNERVEELLNVIFELTDHPKTSQLVGKSGSELLSDRKNQEPERNVKRYQLSNEVLLKHHALAKRAAAESIVLLKNQDRILPLSRDQSVALIGDFVFEPRYQGGGSSKVNPTRLDTLVSCMQEAKFAHIAANRGYRRDGRWDENLARRAKEAAKSCDVAVVCIGLTEISESETMDRRNMELPENQVRLILELWKENENIIVVLSGGSAVTMPWEGCCKAILHGYLGGQAGAGAVADVLTGQVNPSGKLNETYPWKYEDCPCAAYFPGMEKTAEYREGIFVGYRYYDTVGKQIRYPFGFGLSYTTFSYENLSVSEQGAAFTLTNTGNVSGAEVSQLYVGKEDTGDGIFRPKKELKGFQKTFLRPGESKTVTIPFDDKTFRYWNVRTSGWEIEGGTYSIKIGASAADIRLERKYTVAGTAAECPYEKEQLPNYYQGTAEHIPTEEFEALLGSPIPDGAWTAELSVNDTVGQMCNAKNRPARWLAEWMQRRIKKQTARGRVPLNLLFIYNMTFRGMAKLTGGKINLTMAQGLVEILNGKKWKGIRQWCRGMCESCVDNRKWKRERKRK